MPRFSFSEADLKRNIVLEQDWYTFKITKVEDKVSKDSQSLNTILYAEVSNGAQVGVPVVHFFNSKQSWAMIPFWAALGRLITPENLELDVDYDTLVDMKFDGYVTPQEYEGKTRNGLTDFRPATT